MSQIPKRLATKIPTCPVDQASKFPPHHSEITTRISRSLIKNAAAGQIIGALECETRYDLRWNYSSEAFDRFVSASSSDASDTLAVKRSRFNGPVNGLGIGDSLRCGVGDCESGEDGEQGE